ncbi:MAG: sodium-dependent transporter [Alphaproteobacteria bacterium]|nr:sodium-dependent transporter [Alphaproteobacteria bacterium]
MTETWNSRVGFLIASIGAAVGLGNIWRFAYVAGENGGGAFLVVYLAMVAIVAFPLLVAELALGKNGAKDGVTAFAAPSSQPVWRRVGWIGVVGSVLILSYYGVIAGWALRYFAATVSGELWVSPLDFGEDFHSFVANDHEPVWWFLAMMALTAAVVIGGVERGIERANLLLMPLLAVIVLGMAVYALFLPGSFAGVKFLFSADWTAVLEPGVWLAALGQALFSIGVGMAVFVTFGGYMQRGFKVVGSAAVVAIGDTAFAIVAGLAIFPAVFAFGGSPGAGPELAFITLPQVFLLMPMGKLAAAVFFFLLSAAALTSMISLLEVPVAVAIHRGGVRRSRAVPALALMIFAVGIPAALGYGLLADVSLLGRPWLDAVDRLTSNLLLPLAGISVAAFFGWGLERRVAVGLLETSSPRLVRYLRWALRVAPALVAATMFARFYQ